jgi:GNAT superfamily N-acetyltransferase
MEHVEETARRLEEAHAFQSARFAEAMARRNPGSGARAIEVAGGAAIFAGRGSPLSQAVGLTRPLTEHDLDRAEEVLGRPAQVELTPFAAPSLPRLLAARGYRVAEWQLMLARPLETELPEGPPDIEVRSIQPEERRRWARIVMASFHDANDADPDAADAMAGDTATTEGTMCVLALVRGEAAGGASVGVAPNRAAILSGAGVLPRFRGLGVQRALIAARLRIARAAGCDVAGSSTRPATVSQKNLERLGFRILYPKLTLVRD